MFKIANEGYPFILGSLALTALVFIFIPAGVAIPSVLTLFMLYFFRDPDRVVPEGRGLFVSAADGKVILIKDVYESRHIHAGMKQVSVFMTPFNVHVNRAPCSGRVKTVKHSKGRFLAAYREDASFKNENIEMVLETEYGDILVRQVAGFVARRAVCRKKEGDLLTCGERYGMIKFSSRLDVYLPESVDIKVKLNDKVKAGETVIAQIKKLDYNR